MSDEGPVVPAAGIDPTYEEILGHFKKASGLLLNKSR